MVAEQPEWRIGRRPALDGLRGVAVLLVVADHAGFLPEPSGSIGVTVFFVLSGFLITRLIVEARQRGSWSMPRFAADRFVRLFPALVVMVFVVSLVLLAEGFQVQGVADRALPALTYTQNMAPPMRLPVFGHTWSLGVEEQFYLLWPLALPWVLRRSRPLLPLVALIAGSTTLAMMVPGDWLPMHGYALLCGCALGITGPPEPRRWLLPVGSLGLVGAIAVAPHVPRIYVYGPMLATLPAVVLVTSAAASGSGILQQPLLRFTGRISYAFYLWHVPLMRVSGTTYHGYVSLPWIALSAVLAVGSTLMLEEPLRRARRHASAWAQRFPMTARSGGRGQGAAIPWPADPITHAVVAGHVQGRLHGVPIREVSPRSSRTQVARTGGESSAVATRARPTVGADVPDGRCHHHNDEEREQQPAGHRQEPPGRAS